jgi:formate hydrogenlyase subunit 4
MMEWSAALKLLNYACIGFALFLPWGVATGDAPGPVALLGALPLLVLKLTAAGFLLAVVETVSAKVRIFRAPEFLATAFLFAVLGLLVHLLLGS